MFLVGATYGECGSEQCGCAPPPPLPTHAQLFEAASEVPDLLIDAATLTGAARVALGPDVAAVFTTSDTAWEQLSAAASNTVSRWRPASSGPEGVCCPSPKSSSAYWL